MRSRSSLALESLGLGVALLVVAAALPRAAGRLKAGAVEVDVLQIVTGGLALVAAEAKRIIDPADPERDQKVHRILSAAVDVLGQMALAAGFSFAHTSGVNTVTITRVRDGAAETHIVDLTSIARAAGS